MHYLLENQSFYRHNVVFSSAESLILQKLVWHNQSSIINIKDLIMIGSVSFNS